MKTTNETRLRPFTPSDWDAFSGCNTASPEIYYGTGVVVIADGPGVEVIFYPEEVVYAATYPNRRLARRVANALIAAPFHAVAVALLDRVSS